MFYPNRKFNKYNQSRASFNGRMYHSKRERDFAIVLNDHLKRGTIKEVTPQYKIVLLVNGKRITTHIPDFLITLPDGRQKFIEVKGFPTDIWVIKRKLTEALFPEIPYLTNPTDKEMLL